MKIINKNNTSELIYSAYTKREAARALVVKDGSVLLIHSLKYNTYTLPGGGVEAGESSEQAATREVREEVGVTVNIVKEIDTAIEIFDQRNILNVTTCFLAEPKDESRHELDPGSIEAGQEIIWVLLAEAVNLIEKTNKTTQHSSMLRDTFFIEQYLAIAFG